MATMVPLKYSYIIPFDRESSLMVCPYADKEHYINPKGFEFSLNNVSYYKDCGDVGKMEPTVGKPDLSIVKFLDYKVTDKFVDNPIVWQFIDEYMSYSHPKILHLVNFWKPLIPSKSWDSFCEYFNNKKFENIFLDIHNKEPNEDIEICLDEILSLKLDNWIGVDYTHLDKEPKMVAIKNHKNENIGKVLKNPNLLPHGREPYDRKKYNYENT